MSRIICVSSKLARCLSQIYLDHFVFKTTAKKYILSLALTIEIIKYFLSAKGLYVKVPKFLSFFATS